MVDGVNEGVVTEAKDNLNKMQQNFTEADLLVLGGKNTDEFRNMVQQEGNEKLPLWAIYGNVVVSSAIYETFIHRLPKKKTVISTRKPYILNGDCYN